MRPRNVAAIVVLASVFAGCGASGEASTSPAPANSSLASEASATDPRPVASPTAAIGQTDTDWGRIWDAVPADFPRFADMIPSEEAAKGPASATLTVQGDVAKDVATWMAGQLKDKGYAVEGATTALEDGSFVLDASNDPGCRV